jgi:hypothetical protein
VALGRRNDSRVPCHDVIAGKDDVAAVERENEMIGRVAGRVDRRQSPIVAFDAVARCEDDIGLEIIVDEVAA